MEEKENSWVMSEVDRLWTIGIDTATLESEPILFEILESEPILFETVKPRYKLNNLIDSLIESLM